MEGALELDVNSHEEQTNPGKTHYDIQAAIFDAIGGAQDPVY